MGRSVSVPSDAVTTVYIALDDDFDPDFGWDDFIEDVRNVVKEKYPSFVDDDKWVGREDRSILVNTYARIVVAEYCGLVSISIVPDDHWNTSHLTKAWCDRIARSWHRYMTKRFGRALTKLGSASNGESFFRLANG